MEEFSKKQGQYSQEQIAALLRRAEMGEQSISTLCREAGITETTFYRWRTKFGSMSVSEARTPA